MKTKESGSMGQSGSTGQNYREGGHTGKGYKDKK